MLMHLRVLVGSTDTSALLSLRELLYGFRISQNLLLQRVHPLVLISMLQGMSKAALFTDIGPESASMTSGNFFEALTTSDFYKNTKVQDISGSFLWAPFLALQKFNSSLTMLLLLSKYKMKSIPVVDVGEGKIDNLITQSSVIHILAECAGFEWFESWGKKKLSEVGLPVMSAKLNTLSRCTRMNLFFRLLS